MSDAKTTVLLIEDNPGDVRLIRELLAEAGGVKFELEWADSLAAGLARLNQGNLEVVLCDLGLPDSQGLDTFTRLREQAPPVPIVVLTGLDDEALAVAAVRAGAQDYLVKGRVDGDALARTIRYAIERKRIEETLRQRLAELEAINYISARLRAAQALDEMLPLFLDETLEVLHATQGAIWLYDIAKDELRPAVSRGWGEQNGRSPQPPVKPGEGITGYVFASGQPCIAREFCLSPQLSDTARQEIPPGIGGAILPVRAGEIVIGAFSIHVPLPRELTPDQVHLLVTLSEIAGTAIQRTSLQQQTARQLGYFEALHGIDRAISASTDLRMTLNLLLDYVKTQLNADATSVLLLNPHSQTLEYAAGRGFRTHSVLTERVHVGESFAGRATLERRTVRAGDLAQLQASPQFAALWADEGFADYYGVPLIAQGAVKGVLEVYHRAPFHPEPEWSSFLEALAEQAAIAIESGQLFETLQRSTVDLALANDATIEGWSRALDLRDRETEGHTQRVAEVTLQLAQAMGLGDAELELVHIRRGALLHDIGKLGVPESILLKPGPLTDDEWQVMRRHPQLAYDLLAPVGYLQPALDIPYCHHEKWDGTGYPRGLQGEQIPLAARLFAVVDVWDALRSDRPYRNAWAEEQVREHIAASRGTHFDPQVVQAFLELLGTGALDAHPLPDNLVGQR